MLLEIQEKEILPRGTRNSGTPWPCLLPLDHQASKSMRLMLTSSCRGPDFCNASIHCEAAQRCSDSERAPFYDRGRGTFARHFDPNLLMGISSRPRFRSHSQIGGLKLRPAVRILTSMALGGNFSRSCVISTEAIY